MSGDNNSKNSAMTVTIMVAGELQMGSPYLKEEDWTRRLVISSGTSKRRWHQQGCHSGGEEIDGRREVQHGSEFYVGIRFIWEPSPW